MVWTSWGRGEGGIYAPVGAKNSKDRKKQAQARVYTRGNLSERRKFTLCMC